MRLTREVLRLHFEVKLSANEIHRITGVSRDAVQNCIRAAQHGDIKWPLPTDMNDTTLEERLFPCKIEIAPKCTEPDWNWVYIELKKPGVNKQLLWQEYIETSGENKYSYSQFNRRYKSWLKRQELSMRQEHKAGQALFLDYAGQTMPVVDRATGEVKKAQIFLAVLGASNYSYVEASWSQDLPSWITSHVRALNFFKGVPQCLIPDNLKSGVTKALPFDPLLNVTYQRFSQHYKCGIRPARAYRPKDKAKVEKGVQFAETWILARLRNHTFFSLEQLNETIRELLTVINNEPFQKISGTRFSLYESIDLPALRPLPQTAFELEDWLVGVKIEKDYHVTVEGHHYSVPHQLRGERVDIRYTGTIVEILHNNIRAASHPRNKLQNGQSTLDEHRPAQHALYAGMSADKFLCQAESVGVFTRQVITAVLQAQPYPQLAFDKCFGILSSLRRKYGDAKLESAAEYAITIGAPTYRVVKAALESDALPQQLAISVIDSHENIRGPKEFTTH